MAQIKNQSSVIDVVIPAFNAARYIEQTLNSVALQGNIVHSIIVVNDGSTDQTQSIVEMFSKNRSDLNIQLISQENKGLANARNAGIHAASAPFIALLDADDLWVAGKLHKQMSLFASNSHKSLGVVYCGYCLINNDSIPLKKENSVIAPRLQGNVYLQLLTGNFISGSGSSVMIKKDVFEAVGYFDESLKASEDWDMWIRISKFFQFDYVNEELVKIRVHGQNMQKDFPRMLSSELAMLNKFSREGIRNYFLLWKIQTILFKRAMYAKTITGFESSEPWVKSHFRGYRLWLWKATLTMLNPIWISLKKLKSSLNSQKKKVNVLD